MISGRVTAGLCGLLLLIASAQPHAQFTPTLTFSVNGSAVTLSWTPISVPGVAVAYEVQAGLASTGVVLVQNVVTTTQIGPLPVPPGVYQARVRAVAAGAPPGPWSAPVTIPVGGAAGVVPAPSGLGATVNGNAVLLSWSLPTTSGLSGLVIEQLTGSNGAVVQQFPVRLSTSTAMTLPNGSYVARLRAVGAGLSAPSNEVAFTVPSCNVAGSIPITASAVYGFAVASWPSVPGALGYTLSVSQNGVPIYSTSLPANATSASGAAGPSNYSLTLTANIGACGSVSGSTAFVSSAAPPPGPRGAAGLGLGTTTGMVASVTNAMAARYPNELRGSCGNNAWLFRVVNELRRLDNRFGLNWKRGHFGDLSQDVIAYNFSDRPDNEARAPHMYAWDVISGHCGGSPAPNAANITDARGQAAWTILPYLQGGYQP